MTSGSEGIRIDKPADGGIVISALEVVEPGISVVVVTAVTDGVDLADGSQATLSNQKVAPSVIFILCNGCACAVDNPDDIALLVQHIDVVGTVVLEGIGKTAVIVDDIQDIAAPTLTNVLAIQRQILYSTPSTVLLSRMPTMS